MRLNDGLFFLSAFKNFKLNYLEMPFFDLGRYCTQRLNYKLRAANQPKKMTKSALEGRSTIKTQVKPAIGGSSGGGAKRQTVLAPKAQVVTIPKPVIKFTTTAKAVSVDSKVGLMSGNNAASCNSNAGSDVKMEVDIDAANASAVGSIGGGSGGGGGSSSGIAGVKREREDDEFEVV